MTQPRVVGRWKATSASMLALAFVACAAPARAQDAETEAPPTVRAGPDGFSLRSGDGDFELKLRGSIQADARFFLGDGARPIADTFLIRQARAIVELTVSRIFDTRILVDAGEGRLQLLDAYVDIHPWKFLRLRVGKMKAPVSLERLQLDARTIFLERAFPASNIAPNRDIGAQLWGDVADGTLSWALGVFVGAPDGGSVDGDTADEKDFDARIFVHPLRPLGIYALRAFGIGAAVTYGQQDGTAVDATGVSAYRTTGQQTFHQLRTGMTVDDTVLAAGRRVRFTPQAYYYYGPFGILGEYIWSEQRVRLGTSTARLATQGWQAAAVLVLDGQATFEGPKIAHPFDMEAGRWGALELAVRYQGLRADPDAFPTFADPARAARRADSFAAIVSWHPTSNVRVALQFERTWFRAGANGGGDRGAETLLLSRFALSW